MIVTRFGIIPDPPSTPATMHRVEVSHLSDENVRRVRNFLEEISQHLISAPDWKVVHVNGRNGGYWRRAPGAAKLGKALGPEFFPLFEGLLAVGLQAYEDSQRSDLDGEQKLGRASLALLVTVTPPLDLLWVAAKILFPTATDNFTAAIFTEKDPIVAGLSDAILWIGGKRFQEWSAKPSWIDYY